MRITLNLASKPHVDLTAYIKRLKVWILVLAVLVAPLFALWRSESIRATSAQSEEDQLRTDSARLRAEQARCQAQMKEPANAAVLNESHFLNNLFREKSFSWTAVMMDLETVDPAGVQVTTLEPTVQKDKSMQIRLRVNGPRDKSVQLIRNLEHAKRFVAPSLAGETAENAQGSQQGRPVLAPISASSNVNFDILAGYNPLAPPTVLPKAQAADEEEKAAESAPPKTAPNKVAASKAPVPAAPARPSSKPPSGPPSGKVVAPLNYNPAKMPPAKTPVKPATKPAAGAPR